MQQRDQLNVIEVAAWLQVTPAILRQATAALSPAARRWHPIPGAWCVNATLGHLIEAERRGFAGRIRHLLEQDRPLLATWDANAVAAARRDCERDTFELLDELAALRAESVQLVSALRPEELLRAGTHQEVGELRVADLLHEWVHHDLNHTKQILSNAQAFVWPHMGNAQRFSTAD